MAKCAKCSKKGIFLKVNENGVCVNCEKKSIILENLYQEKLKIVENAFKHNIPDENYGFSNKKIELEYNKMIQTNPNFLRTDVIWKLLNVKQLNLCFERKWIEYSVCQYDMAYFLARENKHKDALSHICVALYIDLIHDVSENLKNKYDLLVELLIKLDMSIDNFNDFFLNDAKRLYPIVVSNLDELSINICKTIKRRTIIKNQSNEGIINQAHKSTLSRYESMPFIKQYQFIATWDEKTCDKCGELDGKIFLPEEAKEGVNYPKIHDGCRCTTVAYFPPDEADAMFDKAKRSARDPVTGEIYYVPADMTYNEWIASFTEEQKTYFRARQKMIKYRQDDKKQVSDFRKFITKAKKEIDVNTFNDLFGDFPTRIDGFQRMKYLSPLKWERFLKNKENIEETKSSRL